MNKRFFTLMAAVMLAGSPFASEAFAFAPEENIESEATQAGYTFSTSSTALANGVKFVVKVDDNFAKVADETFEAKNGSFVAIGTAVEKVEEATVFEVRNLTSNALGVTFSLYANGKQVAVNNNTNEKKDASLIFTAAKTKLNEITSVNVAQVGGEGAPVLSGSFGTITKTYDEKLFTEYNNKSLTLSFDATDLVGNPFDAVKALSLKANALSDGSVAGIYFVKGDVTDLLAALEAQQLRADDTYAEITKAAKKLSFVYVKNERYNLNAVVNGEGYKLALISGEEFYAEKNAALFQNAAFQTITEGDELNNPGSLVMTIKPTVGKSTDGTLSEGAEMQVAAVKTSATDTKTYVTTLLPSGSKFTEIKYATMGGNTYFAASEFLKKNAPSVYNVYFTSSNKSVDKGTQTEYHKYLTLNCDDKYLALAKDNIKLNTAYAQWVVTHFNGRYTVTLANCANPDETITLDLQATASAGVYDVTSAPDLNVNVGVGDTETNVNLQNGKIQIKLIPASTTELFASLTEEQIKEGIKLSFTGKNAWLGSRTYYAALDGNATDGYSLTPNVKEEKAQVLGVEVAEATENANASEDYLITSSYAYLNAKGEMEIGTDTLEVPAYYLTYAKDANTKYYAKSTLAFDTKEERDAFMFVKTFNGQAVLVNLENFDAEGAIQVEPGAEPTFVADADICSATNEDFAYVSVVAQDNSDYTTLPAIARHATLENPRGGVSYQLNDNGILEGILSAEPMTFWLDTADSEKATPFFYISKGIAAAEEETPETKAAEEILMRHFMYLPSDDSSKVFDEGSAQETTIKAYILEGTTANKKAIFRPAALIAEDTLATIVEGKDALVAAKADAAKGVKAGLENFQFGICLAEDSDNEYIVYPKAKKDTYLYSLNGKLGFTANKKEAMAFTLGAGDPTANEAIEAESGIEVIGGQGVVTVQGAAGKVITVANILGQTIANQVAASDNVTIAAPAGIVVVSVDGDATKVIVK